MKFAQVMRAPKHGDRHQSLFLTGFFDRFGIAINFRGLQLLTGLCKEAAKRAFQFPDGDFERRLALDRLVMTRFKLACRRSMSSG